MLSKIARARARSPTFSSLPPIDSAKRALSRYGTPNLLSALLNMSERASGSNDSAIWENKKRSSNRLRAAHKQRNSFGWINLFNLIFLLRLFDQRRCSQVPTESSTPNKDPKYPISSQVNWRRPLLSSAAIPNPKPNPGLSGHQPTHGSLCISGSQCVTWPRIPDGV